MKPTTLITDFDNTLYDWFHMWHQSFSAMLAEISRIAGIKEEILIPEIRTIHQRYHTSEYAFLVEELPSLRAAFGEQHLRTIFDDAIHAYRRARKASLSLYEGVAETIAELRSRGVLIVIYTESLAYYTNFRISRLGLDELIDFVYSPPDHELPRTFTGKACGYVSSAMKHAEHRFIPDGVIKPDPTVLLDIVSGIQHSPSECVYLGDSLMKDVAMAQDAKIVDVFAKYGGVQHREEYELLRKVSHWTEEDVQREKATSTRTIHPTHSIENFSEIKKFF